MSLVLSESKIYIIIYDCFTKKHIWYVCVFTIGSFDVQLLVFMLKQITHACFLALYFWVKFNVSLNIS